MGKRKIPTSERKKVEQALICDLTDFYDTLTDTMRGLREFRSVSVDHHLDGTVELEQDGYSICIPPNDLTRVISFLRDARESNLEKFNKRVPSKKRAAKKKASKKRGAR